MQIECVHAASARRLFRTLLASLPNVFQPSGRPYIKRTLQQCLELQCRLGDRAQAQTTAVLTAVVPFVLIISRSTAVDYNNSSKYCQCSTTFPPPLSMIYYYCCRFASREALHGRCTSHVPFSHHAKCYKAHVLYSHVPVFLSRSAQQPQRPPKLEKRATEAAGLAFC